jgi:hypothetical protein
MPIYVYETIPQNAGEVSERFELRQGMNDPKLTVHPLTGKPVKRLVSGGFMLLHGALLASEGLTFHGSNVPSMESSIVFPNAAPISILTPATMFPCLVSQ